MTTTIKARRLIGSDGVVEYPLVTVKDQAVHRIESLSPSDWQRSTTTHSFAGCTLVPSYLDIHLHGCAGHDVMEATPSALDIIARYLGQRGVGAFLPTTVTSPADQTLRALAGLASEINRRAETTWAGATPLGIHLEGPFLSHIKRGVHNPDLLEAPSIQLFDRMWQAAEGRILLMTIAPELPGALELIAHATARGVRCSLGHSNATAAEAHAGQRAGACSATHTFNAMRPIDHREPGIAAFVLDQPDLFAELICDGIHVDPLMVRLFLKAKGDRRAILVTDSISATGMPDGTYRLGDIQVEVHDGRCTANGVLSGSVLTLERAVRNLIEFTGTTLQTAAAAASRNPAQLLGVDQAWGTLAPGRRADFTVLSAENTVVESFLSGTPVPR